MGSSFTRAERRRSNKHSVPEGNRRCGEEKCGRLMSYNVDRDEFFCPRHGGAGMALNPLQLFQALGIRWRNHG